MRRFFTNLSGPQRLSVVGLLLVGLAVQSSCMLRSPAAPVASPLASQLQQDKVEGPIQSPLAAESARNTPTAPLAAASQAVSPLRTPVPIAVSNLSPLALPDLVGETERAVQDLLFLIRDAAQTFEPPDQNVYLAILMRSPQTDSYLPLIAVAPPTAVPTTVMPPTPAGPPPPTPTPLPTPDAVVRSVKVPILMYHYLSVPPAGADRLRRALSVTPDLFADHLDSMLEAGYQTISLYDLTMHLARGNPLPAKPVIITFDDGYRDNYENAFPLLTDRNMTATFFIAPDFIDRQRPGYMDWNMVRTMFVGGMSIEAHGLDHQSLRGQDVPFLAWQSLATIQAIERETGKRPRFISYPSGQYDTLTIEVFHNSHFWAGLTTYQGATHESGNMFEMRRVRVHNTTQPAELIGLMELDW